MMALGDALDETGVTKIQIALDDVSVSLLHTSEFTWRLNYLYYIVLYCIVLHIVRSAVCAFKFDLRYLHW